MGFYLFTGTNEEYRIAVGVFLYSDMRKMGTRELEEAENQSDGIAYIHNSKLKTD